MIICGHIHRPDLREIDGVMYGNCGDWVESCSALVEHIDGRIELLHFGMHAEDGSERLPPVEEHAENQLELEGVAQREALARLSMEFATDLTASGEHRAVENHARGDSDVLEPTEKDSAGDLIAVGE
jgi:hypothetical protein